MKARLIVLAVVTAALVAWLVFVLGGGMLVPLEHGGFADRFQPTPSVDAAIGGRRTADIGSVERLQPVVVEPR